MAKKSKKQKKQLPKKLIGLVEIVKIIGEKNVDVFALFDTGAARTSIDTRLAAKAGLGPIISTARVRHASQKGDTMRPVTRAMVKIKGKIFDVRVSIQDRAHMTFPMIVGRDILTGNFVVDTEKNKELFSKKKRRTDQSSLMKYVS